MHACGAKSTTEAASVAAIISAEVDSTDSRFRVSVFTTFFMMLKYRSHSTEVIGSDAAIVSSLCATGQLLRKNVLDNEARVKSAGESKGQ